MAGIAVQGKTNSDTATKWRRGIQRWQWKRESSIQARLYELTTFHMRWEISTKKTGVRDCVLAFIAQKHGDEFSK